MKVENLVNAKGNRTTNQFIITDGTKKVFQSYKSVVAVIDKDILTLGKDWDYSVTTLKHLYTFLEDNAYAYFIKARHLGGKNMKANFQTLIDNGYIKYDESL